MKEDRVYCDGVNIAARVESLVDCGGIGVQKRTVMKQIFSMTERL